MMIWLLRLIAFCVLAGGVSLIVVAVFLYTYTPPDPLPRVRAIIVLSGPGADTPGTIGETRDRVDKGVELFNENLAPFLVMSGGGGMAEGLSHARYMADRAIELGVPERVILMEGRSGSTLQNAWFSKELDGIEPDLPMIVVSTGYHLPRVWASFRWAGYQNLTLVASDDGPPELNRPLLMEGIKWPANIVRATIAWIAMAAGVPDETVLPWLR